MSNPGVIVLNSSKIDFSSLFNNDRFQIEDNIGEAIHIHYRNIRFDFTISDYLKLSDTIFKCLENLMDSKDIILRLISPDFLYEIREHISYIESTEIIEKDIDELRCVVYKDGPGSPHRIMPVKESPVYKYLQGKTEFKGKNDKGQLSFFQIPQRIEIIRNSLIKNTYPFQNKYITTLGNDNLIRDGYFTAAVVAYINKQKTLPVLKINFQKDYTDYAIKSRSPALSYLRWMIKRYNNKIKRLTKKIRLHNKSK